MDKFLEKNKFIWLNLYTIYFFIDKNMWIMWIIK